MITPAQTKQRLKDIQENKKKIADKEFNQKLNEFKLCLDIIQILATTTVKKKKWYELL